MALITRANLPRERTDIVGEALRGLALGQSVASSIDARRQREQQAQQQQQVNQLARLAAGGDREALQELAIVSPDKAGSLTAIQEFQSRTATEANTAAFKSMVEGAALALNSGNPLQALEQRKDRLNRLGVDTFETQQAIDVFKNEGEEAGKALLAGVANTGRQLGILKPFVDEKIDIEKEKLNIRKLEAQERALDRQLGRETNAIKREQMQLQLEGVKQERENAQREKALNLDNVISSSQTAIDTADKLLSDPGLEVASGLESIIPTIPGTEQADFRARLETLKSQVFLAQVNKMKGLGTLTDAEGARLEKSISSLSTGMSDKALRESIKEIRDDLQGAQDRLKKSEGLTDERKTVIIDGFTVEFL